MSDTFHSHYGVSDERMKELREVIEKAKEVEDTKSKTLDLALSYASTDGERLMIAYHLGCTVGRQAADLLQSTKSQLFRGL